MQIYIHTNNANICMQEISGVLDNDVCRAVHVRYSPVHYAAIHEN